MFRLTAGSLPFAVLLAAGSVVFAQERALIAPVWTTSGTSGVTEVGGRLVGAGPGYKVAFADGEVEFVPVLGLGAPRNLPVRLALRGVGRSGTGVRPVGRGALYREPGADVVRYLRTGDEAVGHRFEERYAVRADGVEQSFWFAETPTGYGDLVVAVELDTELEVQRAGPEGIVFAREGLGGVSFGAVTGIDADGRRVAGRLELRGDRAIEMSLPAAFVDSARAPIVLDPLIGAVIPIARGGHDRNASATWHEGLQRWLCCWETVVSRSDVDVRAQLLDAAGAPIAGVLSVRSGSTVSSEQPLTMPLTRAGMLVVTFVEGGELVAVPLNGNTGAIGAALRIAPGNPVQGTFDADGSVDGNDFLIWQSSFGAVEVASVGPGASGALTVLARNRIAAPAGMSVGSPRLARYERPGGPDELLAIWHQEPVGGGPGDVFGVRLDLGLSVLGAPFGIAESPADERNPSIDGDGTAWLVAWEHTAPGAGDVDLGLASLGAPTSSARYPVHFHTMYGRPGAQLAPEVAWLGESALIAYRDEVQPGSGVFRALLRSIEPFRCTDCEGTFALDTTARDGAGVRIATRFAAGGDRDTALVVWDAPGARGNPRDVLGRMFEARDGSVLDVIPGCGTATLQAACARRGNRNFAVRMFGAEPNARAWMVVSWQRIDIPIGACRLVPDPFAGLVLDLGTTDPLGAGVLSIPIPSDPAVALSSLWFQPLVMSSSSPSGNGVRFEATYHTSCSHP